MKNKLVPYNPKLKLLARQLRQQGIAGEIMLWKQLQNKAFGVEFHRQVPMLDFIVDFYCHELMLVIEIDGLTHLLKDAELKDAQRQKRIEAYGVEFLRFTDSEIKKNMAGVVYAIEAKVKNLKGKTSPERD